MTKQFKPILSLAFALLFIFLTTSISIQKLYSIEKPFQTKGFASWYGPKFHGKTTANGEKYDMYALTAAHKTLPFGTLVKVTNTQNNKSVVVRINDRGPFIKDRIIDLSKNGATLLGFLNKGIAHVTLELVSKEQLNIVKLNSKNIIDLSENHIRDNSKTKNKYSYKNNNLKAYEVKEKVNKTKKDRMKIQFGAFSSVKSAVAKQKIINAQGIKSLVVRFNKNQKPLYRVLSKDTYIDYKKASRIKNKVLSKGIEAIILFL